MADVKTLKHLNIGGENYSLKAAEARTRLTTAEADIETNSEAIKQLKKDVDDTIANLEEIHLDPNADNKYDNTTGNINLYLNDGVTYEESIHYYDGME